MRLAPGRMVGVEACLWCGEDMLVVELPGDLLLAESREHDPRSGAFPARGLALREDGSARHYRSWPAGGDGKREEGEAVHALHECAGAAARSRVA